MKSLTDPFEAALVREFATRYEDGEQVFREMMVLVDIRDLVTIGGVEYWRVTQTYSYRTSRVRSYPQPVFSVAVTRDPNVYSAGHNAWFSGPPDLPLKVGVECFMINGHTPTWNESTSAWEGPVPQGRDGWYPSSYSVQILTLAERPAVWSRLPVMCSGAFYRVKYPHSGGIKPIMMPFIRGGGGGSEITGLDEKRWNEDWWGSSDIQLPGNGVFVTW